MNIKKAKWLKMVGAILALILLNVLALAIIGGMRFYFGHGFLPGLLILPLLAAWLNKESVIRGILRWTISIIVGLAIALFSAYQLAGMDILLQFIAHLGTPYITYLILGILTFYICVWLHCHISKTWFIRLASVLILLLLVGSWIIIQLPAFPSIVREHLKVNSASLNLTDYEEQRSLTLLDPYLQDHDVFFTGEAHASKVNYDIKFKFLKYLNQEAGVCYYLDEGGYGHSILINQYLETGNEEYLKMLMRSLNGTSGYMKESYEFWEKVRNYNMNLPEVQRIRCVGADLEFQYDLSVIILVKLLPETAGKEPPCIHRLKRIGGEIEQIFLRGKNCPNELLLELKKVTENINKTLQENMDFYRDYFGDHFFKFEMIIQNAMNTYYYWTSPNRNIREEAMFRNFKKIYDHLPGSIPKKFYGQWGTAHLYQQPYEFYERFAGMLQHRQNSPVKGRILCVIPFYYRSQYRDNHHGKVRKILDRHRKWTSALSSLAQNQATLFKLIGEESPFEKDLYFIDTFFPKKHHVTCNYFQYLLFIKHSGPATLWKVPQ